MGKKPSGKPWKVQLSVKFDPEIASEIDDLAKSNFAFKTRLIREIVHLGLSEFKKLNPKMVQQMNEWRTRQDHTKKRLVGHG